MARKMTVAEQSIYPEGYPDDFQADLVREERKMKAIYPHTTFRHGMRRFHYSGPGTRMSTVQLFDLFDKLSRGQFETADWSEVL